MTTTEEITKNIKELQGKPCQHITHALCQIGGEGTMAGGLLHIITVMNAEHKNDIKIAKVKGAGVGLAVAAGSYLVYKIGKKIYVRYKKPKDQKEIEKVNDILEEEVRIAKENEREVLL